MPLSQQLKPSPDQDILKSLLSEGSDRERGEKQLFSSYAYFIQQAVNKYSFSEEEAFTIYSDTILAVIPQLRNGKFEARSSLKTWLYQIFHNKCVDLVRKKTTNKSKMQHSLTVSDMLLQIADSAKSVIEEIMERTDSELMKKKLKEIGENCQRMLLYWADGYSDKEIAAAMEYKTPDVVKTSRLRCLEKLRQLYKEQIKK